jgi:hypothetical protein
VRSDAGHLFRDIQLENPYAADARHELFGARSPELREARVYIDAIDRDPGKPTLQFLTITTKDADAALKVDGAPVKREELDFVPVDAGVHQVEAVAQGKKSWSSMVSMPEGSRKVDVMVPPLEVIVGKTRVVTVTKDSSSTKRTLGFVVGGIGLAGLAAAGITGALLLGDKSTVDKKCTPTCVDQDGRDAVSRGKSLLPINAVAWGVGAVGVGTFLILTSGKKATEDPPPQA